VTSVGGSLDRRYYAGNRYHDDDTLDVMLIIFIAQLEYRVFKVHCNKIGKMKSVSRYAQRSLYLAFQIFLAVTNRLDRSVGKIVAGPRQHSEFWSRVPSGPMTIFLLLSLLKWGLLFNERKGPTTTLLGSDSDGSHSHSLTHS
jgi:hypothetical protein